jgi:diguanylate cyclase (GGDEF)-like protein
VAVPILSAGGLLCLATLLIPGYVEPTWWARTLMAGIGTAALSIGVATLRWGVSARLLSAMAIGSDLSTAAISVCLHDHGAARTSIVMFTLPTVLVALYLSGRMLTVQTVVAAVCSVAVIGPCVAVFAIRRTLHRALIRERLLADTDPLTRAANRRGLEESIPTLIARSRATGAPIGVAVVDVDHFKAINDRYGHRTGDQVLKEITDSLRACVRPGDVVARLGGEEFAVLAVLDPDHLTALAERIRHHVAETTTQAVTVSVGLAWWHPEPSPATASVVERIWALVDQADEHMYKAKRDGRNRTHTPTIGA